MHVETPTATRVAPLRSDERVTSSLLPAGERVARVDFPAREIDLDSRGVLERIRRAGVQLGPRELRRRLIHIAPGFLPFILWAIPHQDPLSSTLRNCMIGIAVAIAGWAWLKRATYARLGETGFLSSVLGYAVIVLGMLILIPPAPELGLAVMAIIAFGDGSATLAGLVLGGPRLPWNRGKSWSGLVAFLACSVPMATIIYAGEAQPHVSPWTAFWCAAPAACVAALAESLPSRINDNIRVGLAAAMTIVPLHAMFCGW